MANHGVVEPAKVIVVIDFGTTFSGFSYAHMDLAKHDPDNFLDNVEGREAWPSQEKVGAKPYFKTQTSLLYVEKDSRHGEFELKSWGWTAYSDQLELQKNPDGKPYHYITKFKLALAGSKKHVDSYKLPEGFTAQRVVSDYLQQLSILIEVELPKKYGSHIRKKDIQWCLTVPAIWDNAAKQEMRKCAEMAGLVAGPLNSHKGEASSHPVMIVLEPEAASVYCLHYLRRTHQADLPPRSKILVVDAGGGTVDLAFHEKVDSGSHGQQVKEISSSSGDLCGSTFLDDAFHDFLARRVSCYKEFIREHPSEVLRIKQVWENIKFCFDGSPDSSDDILWLSAHMSNYWETYDKEHDITPASNYDEIRITLEEMRSIFDSVVDKIIDLIEDQLFKEVRSEEEKSVTIMAVGGFSGSPYLMGRIRKSFESRVNSVINPTHPGRAVVTGAVVFGGLGKEVIISRVSRKTYGVVCTRDFHPKDPESKLVRGEDGRPKCTEVFHIYTRKGDPIPVNYCHKMQYTPLKRGTGTGMNENCIEVEVFSTTEADPEFVTDEGCVKECTYKFPVPSRKAMKEIPRIEVSMFFGRTTIEVTAEAVNFKSEKVILPVLTLESEGLFPSSRSRLSPGQV